MALQLKQMKGEEFVRKLLEEERDFSGIKLEKGFDLSNNELFEELNRYLRLQDLENNPVIIRSSEFKYFKGRGLYLPFLKGGGADLGGADLGGADLREAYLREAYFGGADLRGAKNLDKAYNLEYAILDRTKITSVEKPILDAALARKKPYIVED